MPETESKSLLDSFKELFGLVQKKAADGKLSKSGMTRLKSFAQSMDEHGCATREHAKCMHEHGKSACAMGKEMLKFLKDYDPEEADVDDDGEQDDDLAQAGPRKKPAKGRRKDDEPEDTSAGDPPKSAARTTAEVYREQLRHRALTGRGSALVP